MNKRIAKTHETIVKPYSLTDNYKLTIDLQSFI